MTKSAATSESRRTSFTDRVIDHFQDAVEGIECFMSLLATSPNKPAYINSWELHSLLNCHLEALRSFMKEFDEISEGYREYQQHLEAKRIQALTKTLLKSKGKNSRKAGAK